MFTLGLILILGIPFSYGCVAMVQDLSVLIGKIFKEAFTPYD